MRGGLPVRVSVSGGGGRNGRCAGEQGRYLNFPCRGAIVKRQSEFLPRSSPRACPPSTPPSLEGAHVLPGIAERGSGSRRRPGQRSRAWSRSRPRTPSRGRTHRELRSSCPMTRRPTSSGRRYRVRVREVERLTAGRRPSRTCRRTPWPGPAHRARSPDRRRSERRNAGKALLPNRSRNASRCPRPRRTPAAAPPRPPRHDQPASLRLLRRSRRGGRLLHLRPPQPLLH